MSDDEQPYYHGTGFGTAGPGTVTVEPEGRELDTGYENPDLPSHSPDGFQIAYHGSGPAQLAAALLYDVTGDPKVTQRWYQTFKKEQIATMDDDASEFKLTKAYIQEWLAMKREE